MPRMLLPGTDGNQNPGSSGAIFDRSPPKSGANVITAFEVLPDQHPKCVTYLLLSEIIFA